MKDNLFYQNIGKKIRAQRKAKNITLSQVAAALNKSIATVSKYEKGEVAVELEVLVDLCRFLNIDIAELLPATFVAEQDNHISRYGKNFVDRLYVYWYKGGENKIHTSAIENDNVSLKSRFYFDLKDGDNIYDACFTYSGQVVYTDNAQYFTYQNVNPPFDVLSLCVPTMSKEHSYKTGVLSTISYYYQNVALKCIVSENPITDRDFLLKNLQLSKEELKEIKATNFFIF